MSRIGNKPIEIPSGVEVTINGNTVTIKGPKATLKQEVHPNMQVKKEDNFLSVIRPDDTRENKSLHGLTRSLLYNMVYGVTQGFNKELEVNGVGYRAQKQGKNLVMHLGFSHQVVVPDSEDVSTSVKDNIITVSGADKQKVGQFAAQIREKRPPEPYKGKGIKYVDETIRRKEGKTGK